MRRSTTAGVTVLPLSTTLLSRCVCLGSTSPCILALSGLKEWQGCSGNPFFSRVRVTKYYSPSLLIYQVIYFPFGGLLISHIIVNLILLHTRKGFVDIVEALIKAGASVNHCAQLAVTPLSMACKVRIPNIYIVFAYLYPRSHFDIHIYISVSLSYSLSFSAFVSHRLLSFSLPLLLFQNSGRSFKRGESSCGSERQCQRSNSRWPHSILVRRGEGGGGCPYDIIRRKGG